MRSILVVLILFIVALSGCIQYNEQSANISEENTIQSGSQSEIKIINESIENEESISKEPFIVFNFKFKNETCLLNGEIYLNDIFLGETYEGRYNLTLTKFEQFKNKSGDTQIVCIQGRYPSCFSEYKGWYFKVCWFVNITKSDFEINLLPVLFEAEITPRWPSYCYEYRNFVKPENILDKINEWKEIGVLNKDIKSNIEFLWSKSSLNVIYSKDFWISGDADWWKLPNETWNDVGDCEDWSNLLISLIKAYNSSAKCYAIALIDHITTVCKFDEEYPIEYIFYDQKKFFIRETRSYYDYDVKFKLHNWLNTYFNQYGIYSKFRNVTCAYDNDEYFEFRNNDEFLEWLMNL
ncbi:MAG: hypothetical protein QXP39_02490 [Candidatus Aenigmatarchaeota archaeon]